MGRRKEITFKEFLWRVAFVTAGFVILALLLWSGILLKVCHWGAEKIIPKKPIEVPMTRK